MFLLLLPAQVTAVRVVLEDFLAHVIDAIHQKLQTLLQMVAEDADRHPVKPDKSLADRSRIMDLCFGNMNNDLFVNQKLGYMELTERSISNRTFICIRFSSVNP